MEMGTGGVGSETERRVHGLRNGYGGVGQR